MTVFYFFIIVIVGQRIIELVIAKRNEKWMKGQGAVEFGKGHYPYIVLMHAMFFISLFSEVFFGSKALSPLWPWLLAVFVLTQAVRVWALASLGKYWNTKIIVLPNANIIKKGPYQLIQHPNYLVVTIELIIIPMMFEAYATSILFTLLNVVILSIRIPAEEKALKQLTEYEGTLGDRNRFVPKMLKKCDS
jgi:methyltransferase